jgi:hypothetical protein
MSRKEGKKGRRAEGGKSRRGFSCFGVQNAKMFNNFNAMGLEFNCPS